MGKRDTRPTGRTTIRQVADHAGVSVSAVSKVMRDAYGVSEHLRARVRASIHELKYRPLSSARGMRGRTYTIGLILPDIRNPLFADILDGVGAELRGTQYQVVVGITESSIGEPAVFESMIDRQVDGIIVVGTALDEVHLQGLASRLPLVAIGYHPIDKVDFDTVNNDDQEGARLAVRHLMGNGFDNIAMLSLSGGYSTVVAKRELGYRLEMIEADAGTSINIVRVGAKYADVERGTLELLRSPSRPAAIFCWSDHIAYAVASVAAGTGLAIPTDLAIVAYDNSAFSGLAQVSLTSVDQSGHRLGQQAGHLLVGRVSGRGNAEHVLIDPVLAVRQSSCAPGHADA